VRVGNAKSIPNCFARRQLCRIVCGLDVKINQNIKTAFAKIVETDVEIGFVRHRMIGDQLFDARHQLLEFLTRGVVCDLDQKALAAHRTNAEVFDRPINHGVVWN
jgi:hypothetical protein